ncbi:hypothetical protein TREMEDRAFT_59714 [Tremella mesenterica DSM 1558]|uniref:uncharacterized protein n=1 Tax=Tremella mesenterica (strain ATCC 24925 / CBS 8224 / DSM 1558 / NBRC 9311 / NRRL Y-6157 / RJB 2259-6 / UBC 559-6) TaxID=578456 RepID=UPI0003F4983B|nr:uncharacterized protein TREMEDRAFT_59714 [Tremella mesenterica DSM 1558]EIW73539.1 hypothetical protein TREMEDRAFT_59714 [Tremella mesenterica DSM 1558]
MGDWGVGMLNSFMNAHICGDACKDLGLVTPKGFQKSFPRPMKFVPRQPMPWWFKQAEQEHEAKLKAGEDAGTNDNVSEIRSLWDTKLGRYEIREAQTSSGTKFARYEVREVRSSGTRVERSSVLAKLGKNEVLKDRSSQGSLTISGCCLSDRS